MLFKCEKCSDTKWVYNLAERDSIGKPCPSCNSHGLHERQTPVCFTIKRPLLVNLEYT